MLPTPGLVGVSLVLFGLLVGCGAESEATGAAAGGGGNEPLSPRALAAVVAEHTGPPSLAEPASDMEELGSRLAAAVQLRYGTDGGYDGDLLAVGVGANLENILKTCDAPQAESVAGCAKTDDGLLFWERHTPQEDPGVVYVQVSKGDTDVIAFYAGPEITGDPRGLEMAVSVDDMFAIASDPRVDVTTSVDAVEAGNAIDFWVRDTGQ